MYVVRRACLTIATTIPTLNTVMRYMGAPTNNKNVNFRSGMYVIHLTCYDSYTWIPANTLTQCYQVLDKLPPL